MTQSIVKAAGRASAAGKGLELTPKEFQLLEYFLQRVETVVRRTTLLEKIWDMHVDPEITYAPA